MSFCSKETPSILTPHLSVPQGPHWALGELLLAQLLEQPHTQAPPPPSLRQVVLIGGGKCHSDIAAAVALILVFFHYELLTSHHVKELGIMSTEGLFAPIELSTNPSSSHPSPSLTLTPVQNTCLSTGLPRRADD